MIEHKKVVDGKVMWIDARGALIPQENIKPVDQLRDDLVRDLIRTAKAVNGYLVEAKREVERKIDDFLELSAGEYGVRFGGVKGNVELKSFDGTMKVAIAVAEYLEPDERIQVAKVLIDKCLVSWSAGANRNLVGLVQDAFKVNKKGGLDVHRLVELQRYDIDDEGWKKAMEALKASLRVGRTSKYIRFYAARRDEGGLDPVTLDWSKL